MPMLLELQRAFARQLLPEEGAESDGLDACDISAATVAPQRVAIYRNTCISTLVNALALSFPVVRRLVGADFFAAAAQQLIRLQPPASAYLNDYGSGFALFLRSYRPAQCLPYLPDVAQLEWSVNRALHAPDRRRLDSARLAALAPSELACVALVPHASLALLQLQSPADLIWRAVLEQDETAMAQLQLASGPVLLLIERDEEDLVRVQRVSAPEWQLLARLCAGESVQSALAYGLERSAAEDWTSLLAQQLAARRFVDMRITQSTGYEAQHP
jgi:hypothetical protein